MASQPATDRVAYLRLRRRARIASVAFLLVGARLAYLLARLADGPVSPFAVIPFLGLVVLGVVAWVVLRGMWRRSFAARPVTLRLDPATGELVDPTAVVDAPPGRHQSFTGEVRLPRRW